MNSELQSGKKNLLSILSQTGDECKINFTRVQDYLNSCKKEKDAIFSLVSTQYLEMISAKKFERNGQPSLGLNISIEGMLNAMNGNSIWMEKEIENIKEFSKVNLTALIPSVNWTLSKVMNENDTALDILRKVHSGIKTELETIMNSKKYTINACEKNLMLAKDNFELCNNLFH